MLQGEGRHLHVRWVDYDGVGREARNGLNFTERGFGPRAAVGVLGSRPQRGLAGSKAGDLPVEGPSSGSAAPAGSTRAASSARSRRRTAGVAREASGGRARARRADLLRSQPTGPRSGRTSAARRGRARSTAPSCRIVDCLFGNEEDFVAALGFEVPGVDEGYRQLDTTGFRRMISEVVATYPNISVVATSLRTARSASVNGWGGVLYCKGEFYEVAQRRHRDPRPRRRGDSFASGIIYGLLSEQARSGRSSAASRTGRSRCRRRATRRWRRSPRCGGR